ncbi:MAG TPA: ATP-grasp domain-containing protein [Gemmatimonadales bacterium]|nr:ATP-grasp domain-containing protein [Gemmatimonadales bacterium]
MSTSQTTLRARTRTSPPPRSSLSRRLLLLLPTATYRTAAFVAAARRLAIDLTVASELPSTFEAAQPDRLLTLDFAAPEHAAAQARAFTARFPIHGVVGVDDDTAVIAAAVAGALALRGNPLAAALAARDKHRQRELLAAAGVAVPHFELHSLAEDPAAVAASARYPNVLKPLRLAASRGVIRADDPAGFVAAWSRLAAILAEPDVARCGPWTGQCLVEDFIGGPELAVEGLVTAGRLHVLALFDKPDPLDGPFFEETLYVTPSRLAAEAQRAVAACTQAAVTALGVVEGPVHAELRYNARGPWLIELAARPIGGRCSAVLRFREGGTLEELIVRHALGLPLPSLARESQAAGVMMIPVPRAGVLRGVRGVAAARAVPLVEEVVITAPPGQALVPWPEGSRYPGFIFARGETPEAVAEALRAAHACLEFLLGAAD